MLRYDEESIPLAVQPLMCAYIRLTPSLDISGPGLENILESFKCVLYKDMNEEGVLDVKATRAPVQSVYSLSVFDFFEFALSLSARATKLSTLDQMLRRISIRLIWPPTSTGSEKVVDKSEPLCFASHCA